MSDTLGQVPYGTTRNPFNYDKFEQISRDLTTNWLTIDEIAQQLNLGTDESQDTYLESLELAVRMHIEDYLGMSIFPTSYRVYYGVSSIYASPISLDLPAVSYRDSFNSGALVINKVGYYNADSPSVLVTLPATDYYYDDTGNKVILPNGTPNNISMNRTSPLIVEYTQNANFTQNYPVIKQAGLLLFTHLYNNRSESVAAGLQKIPYGVDCLLRPYKPLIM
jgi:hypothetical protein